MVDYSQEELLAKWEEFFEEHEYHGRILSLADEYPETRSLEVKFEDLNRYDTDFAIFFLKRPQTAIAAGEETINRLVPPMEEELRVHLRLKGIPRESRIQIRHLRSKHLGTFIAIEGLVRKATEVRPKITDASFRCVRCGTVIKEPQEGSSFREPMECYEDQGGCKRSATATKFVLLGEASAYLDTQKIEIQEAPEGLRGGEEPQRLTAYVDDDLTGLIMPGDRVVLNGTLRSSQRMKPGVKQTMFDIFLEINSIEVEQVEFEEIQVSEADVEEIRKEAEDPDIFRHIVASIAPSIYGLEVEKEALSLQLFGGVGKKMPDGRRLRGDIHVLLVGDPGCLVGDERVVLGDGTIAMLKSLGREHLEPIRKQVRLGAGLGRTTWATRFHKYERQPILEVVTDSGKCIRGTYNHPLLVWNPDRMRGEWRRLDELSVGDRLRVAPIIRCWKRALVPTGWKEPRYYHDSWHVKVPMVADDDLAAIMGYIVGDGWIQKRRVGYVVAEGELDLAPKLTRLFKSVFGVKPNRQARRGKTIYYQVDRTAVARWLSGIRVKRIPDVVFQSRNTVASSFLRWLYEADGTCYANGRGRTAISLKSTSRELLRDVQALLLRWGIHSSILWQKSQHAHMLRGGLVKGGPAGSLMIRQTHSILRFAKNIGFESRKKKTKLARVVEYVETRKRRWHASMTEKVVSVRKAGRATVYDIEVPGPQRFIANGIVSHNTAKSELLAYMSKLSPRGILATGRAASAAGLCVAGDSLITTASGMHPIESIALSHFSGAERNRPIETANASGEVATFDGGNRLVMRSMTTVWRLKPPSLLLDIVTRSGLSLRLTPATKLLVDHAMGQAWMQAKFITKGMRVATARQLDFPSDEPVQVLDLLRGISTRIAVEVDPEFIDSTVKELRRKFGTIREAAARLLISENSLFHGWRHGRHAIPLASLLKLTRAADVPDGRVVSAIRFYSQQGGHRISLPTHLDKELAYFAGLIAGDGSVEPGALGGVSIRFSNSNPKLIREYSGLVHRLFSVDVEFTPQTPQRAATSRFHSRIVGTILSELGVPPSPKSARLALPKVLLNGPRPVLAAYVRGLFDTDGTVQVRKSGSTCVSLSTASRGFAELLRLALLRFGIHAHLRTRHVRGRRSIRSDGRVIVSRHDQHVLDIRDWSSISRFRESIGFNHPEKARRLDTVAPRHLHSNLDLISGAGPHLREVRRLLGLSPVSAYGVHQGAGRALEGGDKAATHATLQDLVRRLQDIHESMKWEGVRIKLAQRLAESITTGLRAVGIGPKSLANNLNINVGRATDAFYRSRRRTKRIPVLILQRLGRLLESHDASLAAELEAETRPIIRRLSRIPSRLEFLRTLASSDVRWEPVAEIRPCPANGSPSVYDLTVNDAHAFVANGILVHNTAAAVKDEFGEGRWTLEAGALVLADKGLACLSPDSEVLFNGLPRTIESLFDATRASSVTSKGRILELAPIGCRTLSLDLNTLRTRNAQATLVARRLYDGPMLRVTLESGFELKLTPDHLVLDGETLEWKSLQNLRPSGRLVAMQRLPGKKDPVYILDMIPDDWIVQLNSEQKSDLRRELLTRFLTLAAANRHYDLSRDFISGRGGIKVVQFKKILHDFGLYDVWKNQNLAYGRSGSTERLRVCTISPHLAYLLGFIYGDGHVQSDRRHSSVSIVQSRTHLRNIQNILSMTKAVSSRTWGMHGRVTRSMIRGRSVSSSCYTMHRGSNLVAHIYNWLTGDRLANLLSLDDDALRGFLAGAMDSDGCISLRASRKGRTTYSSVDVEFKLSSDRQANLRFMMGLRRFDVYSRLRQDKGVLSVQVTSRDDVARLQDCISPYSVKCKSIPKRKIGIPARHEEVPSEPLTKLLNELEPRPSQLLSEGLWSTFHGYAHSDRRAYKGSLSKLTEALRPWTTAGQDERLRALATNDYALERIAALSVEHYNGYVYDLRVPDGENFLCDGAVVHNCIDEMDKMNPQDRSAIHEALEQQRVSVAKAGITAVLQARCAVLGAANPKFGRFDEHKYISEQIDMPPTLLSRFDIIFSMIDRPQAEYDRNLADHILRGHLAGELLTRREHGEPTPPVDVREDQFKPYFDQAFFRKYVAYAKRIFPIMSPEAVETLRAKYLEIRKQGEVEGSAVPITPRQLEAYVRLSEASARARLSPIVSADDAARAVRIVEYWLSRVSGEGGRIDIDIITTGVSHSQREQMILLRDILRELAGEDGTADQEDIIQLAEQRGIPSSQAERILKRWKEEGEVYTPTEGKYRIVTRL